MQESLLIKYPNERAEYWNKQGCKHLFGIDKIKDKDRAAECFRKAREMGSDAATYNLVLMMAYGDVQDTKGELESLSTELVQKGIITSEEKSSLSELVGTSVVEFDGEDDPFKELVEKYNPDLVEKKGLIISMRCALERKLKLRIANKRPDMRAILSNPEDRTTAGEALNIANKIGAITPIQYEQFGSFMDYSKELSAHFGTNIGKQVKSYDYKKDYQKIKQWDEMISKF